MCLALCFCLKYCHDRGIWRGFEPPLVVTKRNSSRVCLYKPNSQSDGLSVTRRLVHGCGNKDGRHEDLERQPQRRFFASIRNGSERSPSRTEQHQVDHSPTFCTPLRFLSVWQSLKSAQLFRVERNWRRAFLCSNRLYGWQNSCVENASAMEAK